MKRLAEQLRRDALRIWQAALAAVDAERLVRESVRVEGGRLHVADNVLDLTAIRRIVVVGAGKAGAGMAAGLEQALGPRLLAEKHVTGWINVPADCVRPLQAITLHAARPPGRNEPTAEGAAGSRRILKLVEEAGADDLCLCLLSGGGSALLPAPVDAITLDDKLAVTRRLSAAGANIAELNTVRKQLSRIKGGGLARARRAGRLITLIISDVIGDPLDVIGSGPTVVDTSTPAQALEILDRYQAREAGISQAVFEFLKSKSGTAATAACDVTNLVIANNALAVDAAGVEAERLGYSHAMHAATGLEGQAEDVGRHLAVMARQMRDSPGPNCLITGGEPVVRLADAAIRGLGGRNQQLVLAALNELGLGGVARIAILSGGTDGEDGPTDAAGAFIDQEVARRTTELGLDPSDYLRRNDAYHFFGPLGALIKTGPTHTNVCDVRVVVVDRD
jgi:hydroxypyruvate reductase